MPAILVGQRDRDPFQFTGEWERTAFVRAIDLGSIVKSDIKVLGQGIRTDVHPRDFGFVDFCTVHVQFAGSPEWFGQLEVELQVRTALWQTVRTQVVVHAVKKVVIEVQLVILDVHGVTTHHTTTRYDDSFFIAFQIDSRFNSVRSILYRCGGFFGDANGSLCEVHELLFVAKQGVVDRGHSLHHVVVQRVDVVLDGFLVPQFLQLFQLLRIFCSKVRIF